MMPWLPNGDGESYFRKHQQMLRELARLQILSSKEVKDDKDDREKHYEPALLELDKDQEFLDGYIEECENTEYMSPYQWMFCKYYHDVSHARKSSETKLKEWYADTKDAEKPRVSIIHGVMSPEHFLYAE
nr:hypothetical protein [Niallia taxi]